MEEQSATPKPRDPRALNAYRHGLTGQVLIFTPEDEAAYKAHCACIHEFYALSEAWKPNSSRRSPTTAGASSTPPP